MAFGKKPLKKWAIFLLSSISSCSSVVNPTIYNGCELISYRFSVDLFG